MSETFYVDGRFLRDNGGRKIILRGVNLPLLDDWAFPGTDKLSELEKTGANTVRIQWYANYGNPARPPYSLADLDAFLERCRTSRLVPILMLADCTCERDANLVNTKLIPWWTRADVLRVLKRHARYLIINLGNEVGSYRFAGSSPQALTDFANAYQRAITSVRNAGLTMPIMIDAPDCGTSIHAFTSGMGRTLIDHDPGHNIVLSVHAYWAGYNGTAEVPRAYHANLPIVFGEIANKQAETITSPSGQQQTIECYYDLDGTNENHPPSTGFKYQELLVLLTQYEVGWLAWSWWKDNCPSRQMTPTGNYTGAIDGSPTGLTPYGEEVVNNTTYGIRRGYFRTVRTQSLPGAPPAP